MDSGSATGRALRLISAVALVGVAACSPGTAGSEQPTAAVLPVGPSSSAPASTANTRTPPVGAATAAPLPAAAREHTPKGAEAFVRHFLAEYNRAVTLPAVGLLRPMSLPTCKTCAGLEDDAQALITDSERYAVAPLRVDGVTCVACGPEQGQEWFIHALVEQRNVAIANHRGNANRRIRGASDVMQFAAQWRSARWAVAEIKLAR